MRVLAQFMHSQSKALFQLQLPQLQIMNSGALNRPLMRAPLLKSSIYSQYSKTMEFCTSERQAAGVKRCGDGAIPLCSSKEATQIRNHLENWSLNPAWVEASWIEGKTSLSDIKISHSSKTGSFFSSISSMRDTFTSKLRDLRNNGLAV